MHQVKKPKVMFKMYNSWYSMGPGASQDIVVVCFDQKPALQIYLI